MRNLISLHFVDISDEDWINCSQVRRLVKRSIVREVSKAESIDQIVNNKNLNLIFKELSDHKSAKDYTRYLFSDLFNAPEFYIDEMKDQNRLNAKLI